MSIVKQEKDLYFVTTKSNVFVADNRNEAVKKFAELSRSDRVVVYQLSETTLKNKARHPTVGGNPLIEVGDAAIVGWLADFIAGPGPAVEPVKVVDNGIKAAKRGEAKTSTEVYLEIMGKVPKKVGESKRRPVFREINLKIMNVLRDRKKPIRRKALVISAFDLDPNMPVPKAYENVGDAHLDYLFQQGAIYRPQRGYYSVMFSTPVKAAWKPDPVEERKALGARY